MRQNANTHTFTVVQAELHAHIFGSLDAEVHCVFHAHHCQLQAVSLCSENKMALALPY